MVEEGTNRAIVKNTLILYARSFVMMAIGIFTSRIILQAVGVENFGIYGVVGSLVGMFTILNGVLSAGSSRFLTFELGRKDAVKLKQTFNASFAMHCGMAAAMLILFETVGLWFVCHKLNIPEGREFAAHVIYQLSVVSCLLSITQVPYGAVIVAHEKFDIYAYVGIAEVLFKLALPLAMLYIPFVDNLIAFGAICTVWSIGLQIFYRIYCHCRFQETHLQFCRVKSIYKSMLGYSLWDLLGQFCGSGTGEVENILINMFFGVRFNASRAMAYQVESKVDQFNGQFITSVVPQITKSYAQGDLKRFFELINEAGRFSFFLILIPSLPLFLEAEYIVGLWLVEAPPMMIIFLRFILFSFLLRSPSRPLITGVHATGDVKFLNLTGGLHVVLTYCPAIYVLYRLGFPVWSCCCVLLYRNVVSTILEAWSLKRKVNFDMGKYFAHVYGKSMGIAVLAAIPSVLPRIFMDESFSRMLMTCIVSAISCFVFVWTLGLSPEFRALIIVRAKERLGIK